MQLGSALQSIVLGRAVSSIMNITIKQRTGTLVLDPLSVIVILATNSAKPIGTKLYFGNGILELHDAGVLQGTIRTWVGENKMAIKFLNHPIIYACKHFFQFKRTAEVPRDIIFLFQKAKQGLENLKHTYRDDRDVHAFVNTYINIITASIEMKSETSDVLNMLITLKLSDIAYLPSEADSNVSIGPANIKNNLYEELHRSWDANKISTIVCLLREVENATPYGQRNLFVAIDAFMMCIHEKTKERVEIVFEVK